MTMNSEAAEHSVSASEGGKKSAHKVAANGTNMANQVVSATRRSGQWCRSKLQVTDVHRLLISVSCNCDASQRVIVEANSGYSQSVPTCEEVQRGFLWQIQQPL